MKSIVLLILIIVGMIPFEVWSQESGSEHNALISSLDSAASKAVHDIIYIQTSKEIYESGEDLWFKAYVLDNQFFIPSRKSKNLYVQVVAKKSKDIVWQECYEINNGFSDGHIFLADSLKEGTYWIEAFTQNSLFDDDELYRAIGEIDVRKNMKPRPFFIPVLEHCFEMSNDSIQVGLKCLDAIRSPLFAEVEATLRTDEEEIETIVATTNKEGLVSFVFKSPANLCDTTQLRLHVKAKYGAEAFEDEYDLPYPKDKLQFNSFAEGGNLISGLPSLIAFKAVNCLGKPQSVTGQLYEDDQVVSSIKSFHDGMGSVRIVPRMGKNYSIRLDDTDSVYALPAVREKGMTLQLDNVDEEYVTFKVRQNISLTAQNVYLQGQMRGVTYTIASGAVKKELQIKIPMQQFPQCGIAQFTLYNEDLLPIAERLVFVNSKKRLRIEAHVSKKKYNTREKATVEIKVRDVDDNPVVAHLGMSVYDKIYSLENNPHNILTHCLLSSELKGRIHQPDYYFNPRNEDALQALDLLLLTQGWRRYVWDKEVLRKEDVHQAIVEEQLRGVLKVKSAKKKIPALPSVMMVFNHKDTVNKRIVMTDSIGQFIIDPVYYKIWQGDYIYMKPLCKEEFKPNIVLETPFDNINEGLKYKTLLYPSVEVSERKLPKRPPLILESNVIELSEVTIKSTKKNLFRDKYLGHLDSLAKFDLCPDYVAPCGFLNCPTCGHGTRPVEGRHYYKWVGKRDHPQGTFSFTADETEYVPEYHFPTYTEAELLKLFHLSRIKAYYKHREFYQPNYDKENNPGVPDARNTLLWQPNIVTDENGEATVSFYCSDVNVPFVGKIEGVDGSGQLGMTSFKFRVLKK
ncbi:hypothetical protein EYV94_11465 [Puteibacter caeruleilacunae]|nr:hypothetical protein EYV94_11465 [Puteibacter caeruleilacunae]